MIETPLQLAHEMRTNQTPHGHWHEKDKLYYNNRLELNGQSISVSGYFSPNRLTWASRRAFEALDIFNFKVSGYDFVVQEVNIYEDSLHIEGQLQKKGVILGEWGRRLYYSEKTRQPRFVKHSYFTIDSTKHRGRGLGSAWIKSCMKKYQAAGFSSIKVEAAGDNGRYTWAAMGFELEKDYHQKNKANSWHRSPELWDDHKDAALKIIQRAAKRGTDPDVIRLVQSVVENGIPKSLPISKFAEIGKTGPWRDRKRNHLGKALLLIAEEWDGEYRLAKAA